MPGFFNGNSGAAATKALPSALMTERVTPARRGRRQAASTAEPPLTHHAAMTWAQRLKRVFKLDLETCETCGGRMKVIAVIEDPAVIKRLLAHLGNRQRAEQHPEHPTRAPPPLTLPGLMD